MLLIFVYSPMTLKVGQGHNHFSGTPLLWQGYVQSPPMIGIHYSALCELSTVFPGKSGPHFQRKKSPNGTVKYTPPPPQPALGTQLSLWVWSQLGRSSLHGFTWHFMYMHRKPGDTSYPNFLFVLLNYKSSGGVCFLH